MKLTHYFLASLFILCISSCNKSSSGKGEGPDTLPPIATPVAPSVEPVQAPPPVPSTPKHAPGKFGDTTVTASGLMYIDIKVGKGAMPKKGQKITVNYTGKLTDGKIFDSNVDPSKGHVQPFVTPIGVGKVIPGWDEGMVTMKVGGKRKLIIPSDLGYGAQGQGADIPPNSTLIFDVELLKAE
jgi:peptidylprolyl isomerase